VRAPAGQRVGSGHCQFVREAFAIRSRLQSLAGGLLAVPGSGTPILSGQLTVLRSDYSVLGGAPTLLGGAQDDLRPEISSPPVLPTRRVASLHRQVAGGGGVIPCERSKIACVSDRIAFASGV